MAFKRLRQCSVLLAVLFVVSCTGNISASEARQKADDFAKAEYSLDDLRLVNVETVERPSEWVVTYSAKGEAMGGPLVVGVDKATGRTHLIGGAQ